VDVEPDGVQELIFGTASGLACVDIEGRPRWRTEREDLGKVDAPVHLCDLEGDGRLEAIAGSLFKQVICVDAREGKLRWTYPMDGAIEGAVQTADMDGDGILDVILTDQSGRISCLSGRQRAR
jgi:outer membrane protein assembly factor BamB